MLGSRRRLGRGGEGREGTAQLRGESERRRGVL